MNLFTVDGTGLLMFLELVSQFYQGLGPIDPLPYYEPEAIRFPEPLNAPMTILDEYDPSSPPPWEHPDRSAMEFVALRLTAKQLTEIHGYVTKGMENMRISRVDVMIGLLARCLTEIEPELKAIDTVCNVVNVRPFKFVLAADSLWHSTAEWEYTQRTRGSTQSFGSPREFKTRKTPALVRVFWRVRRRYASQ